MKKLVNLRHLLFEGWNPMPTGLDTLTGLHTLTRFVVGNETSRQDKIGKLSDLKPLVNLRGELTVVFDRNFKCEVAEYQRVDFIRVMQLKKLRILFQREGAGRETLLGSLHPHNKLKEIHIRWYCESRLPNWVDSLTTSLPNLVKIELEAFEKLVILPCLSQLRHLKCLELSDMPNVEFIEGNLIVGHLENSVLFFPSLEELKLCGFPKLKGWSSERISRVTFPSLRELFLYNCPRLTTLPSCPKLCDLYMEKWHEALTLVENPTMGHSSSLSSINPLLYMNTVTMDNIGMLDSLFGESLGGIHLLGVVCSVGDSLSTVAEKCLQHASSIKSVTISAYTNAAHIPAMNLKKENNSGAGPTISSLESFYLSNLPGLVNLPKEFQYLTTLQSISIEACEDLEALPEWIDCLTSLTKLEIGRCDKLKSLPEAIAHMPRLQTLSIYYCEILKRRCRQPDGEDWPKISHIPDLDVW